MPHDLIERYLINIFPIIYIDINKCAKMKKKKNNLKELGGKVLGLCINTQKHYHQKNTLFSYLFGLCHSVFFKHGKEDESAARFHY